MTSTRPVIGWIPDDINPLGLETICDLLDHCCEQYGSKPVFTSLGLTITYNELNELSAAFANYLQTKTTLQRGDRIAVQLPNIVQYPVCYLVLYARAWWLLIPIHCIPQERWSISLRIQARKH